MASKKQQITGGKDRYPLFIWLVMDDDDEPLAFKSKKEALDFINEELEESEDENVKSGIVGTYSLVGLKKLSKRVQVIEEDVE